MEFLAAQEWGALRRKRSVPPNTGVPPKIRSIVYKRNPVDRLRDQKVINAACTHSGSPGMPDRDECDWDLAELYYMGHLEVNIAPWKGSVLLHRVDEPAEAQNY